MEYCYVMYLKNTYNTGALATTVFGPGEGGPVFLSEVQCTGTETQLAQCPSAGLGQHNCGLQDSTGVFCDTRGVCPHIMHCIFSSPYTHRWKTD